MGGQGRRGGGGDRQAERAQREGGRGRSLEIILVVASPPCHGCSQRSGTYSNFFLRVISVWQTYQKASLVTSTCLADISVS